MRAEENPYVPKSATVVAVKNESLETKTLRLRLYNWRAEFQPGQFVQLLLPGVGEAPFCIASSPSDQKHLDLTIIRRGLVTIASHYMRPGDVVGIRGPLGRPFPIGRMVGKDLLIVGTGIGIAALRSLILFVAEHREEFGEVHLLYGARFPEDLVYRDEVKSWAEGGMDVRVTLSKASPDWGGLRGRVTDHLEGVVRGEGQIAVLCGSPLVMSSISAELLRRGLRADQVFVSLERHMKCGIGKCARCLIPGGLHVCRDGPVFSLDEISLEAIGE